MSLHTCSDFSLLSRMTILEFSIIQPPHHTRLLIRQTRQTSASPWLFDILFMADKQMCNESILAHNDVIIIVQILNSRTKHSSESRSVPCDRFSDFVV